MSSATAISSYKSCCPRSYPPAGTAAANYQADISGDDTPSVIRAHSDVCPPLVTYMAVFGGWSSVAKEVALEIVDAVSYICRPGFIDVVVAYILDSG